MNACWTKSLGRIVELRPDTSDGQVWTETFVGQHHLPPTSMRAPATVLNLGANIGLVAAHYQVLWPNAKIVAVEMDKACCDLIHRNAPGVEVVPSAVSAQGGWGSYDPDQPAYARRFVPGDEDGTLVHSRTLTDLIDSYFLHGVDLVKMDIEGAEWDLFETADQWAPLVRNVLAELHGDLRPDVLVHLATKPLQLAGYTVLPHSGHPQAVWATR